ncbi:hypothetical protein Pelo_10186 [Pelomyxa schiedti]|nr:hypothetical protein Pelo_10186 [Pelomyxa schiedti]
MGLSSWMFLVVVVLGLAGVVTCEVGDEQMAQVFEAALLELKLSSVFDVSLDDYTTIKYLFFGVDIKLKESANECLQELLFNTAVLAVRITSDVVTLGANVTTFFTQIVSPLSVIFRKEIPEENKINRNDMTEWWETGNGQLLAAYDLAFTNMISSGFYEELFSYFKVPSYFVTDCTLDETKAEYPKTPVGTFFNVLDKRQLKIGVFPVEALPFVKVTPQGEATGILVTLEQQVASWISLRYGSPINISYVVYPNSDAIFDHLDAGDIHCTNLYFSLGGITKANKRRKLEYLSSCAAYGAPLKIVMLSSYSIKSLPGLVDLLKRNTTTTWEVGARPQGTAQLFAEELLTLGIENFHMTVYPSKSAALEAVASGEIIALMPDYPVDLDKNDSAIMSVFEGNVFKISGAFFRQDKVFPCHNGELDKEFGEECDSTQSNCLNCECVGIFQEPSGSLSCEINTPIVVGVTISAAIVLIILIAGIATASVFSMRYLKRKYQQDGAQKLKAGIMFSRRNISQSEMQIPLTNPLVSS